MREMGQRGFYSISPRPQFPSLTCPVGEEPECKDIIAKLQRVKVGDCKSEEEVDIHYCEVRGPWLQ